MSDLPAFHNPALLQQAIDLLGAASGAVVHPGSDLPAFPQLGNFGQPEAGVLDALAPVMLEGAAQLGHPGYFAHMDPPTPSIAQAGALWAAALNQNLLHSDTGPVARQLEQAVVAWLAPFFAMSGGHMTAGSSLANLTALWTARESRNVRRVVASDAAHLSIRKAASILGLEFVALPTVRQRLDAVPDDLSDAVLVLTAGTTSVGAIDDLGLGQAPIGAPAWVHVDCAWAGPLRLSQRHRSVLDGIEHADSLVVSAHKWLYQPKESAVVLFDDVEASHAAISFGGGYLAAPNIGLQGSHGLTALPLYLTALAWGSEGFARRIEADMDRADAFAEAVRASREFEVWGPNVTGVVAWRPVDGDPDDIRARLDGAFVSAATIEGERWWRSVAANPMADIELVLDQARRALAM